MKKKLPELPDNVEYLGDADHLHEVPGKVGGLPVTTLWASYRVDEFTVNIGWTVGHPFGSFREPNKIVVDFDSDSFAHKHGQEGSDNSGQPFALSGITTKVLRKIPMAHARALMREKYESLSVADVRREITPLPSRVETDHDYVHITAAYVALGSTSVEPIKRLSEWTDESPETWSARLRRARAKGILEGTGQHARVAPAYQQQADEIWTTMRARKGPSDGN